MLRIYDPPECAAGGDPLDWERCRTCDGSGTVPTPDDQPGPFATVCVPCEGHGSLRAAALAYHHGLQIGHPRHVEGDAPLRCESCSHPLSNGTWGDPEIAGCVGYMRTRADGEAAILRGDENPLATCYSVHYSPCDDACDHGGQGRAKYGNGADGGSWAAIDLSTLDGAIRSPEASWRQVDIRRMGWRHDLRPEKLSVLCTRCYAERTKT